MNLALAQRFIYPVGLETPAITGRADNKQVSTDYKVPKLIKTHHLESHRIYSPSFINYAARVEVIELDKVPNHKRAVLDLVDAYIDKHGLGETSCISYKYDEDTNTLTLRLGQALEKDEITLWRYNPRPTKAKVYFHEAEQKSHLSTADIRMRSQIIQDAFNAAHTSVTKVLTKEENRKLFTEKFENSEADHHITYFASRKDNKVLQEAQKKAQAVMAGTKESLFRYEDDRLGIKWFEAFIPRQRNPHTRPNKNKKPDHLNPHEVLHSLEDTSISKGDNSRKITCYPSLDKKHFSSSVDGIIRFPHRESDIGAKLDTGSTLKGENPERDIENLLMLVFCGQVPDLKWKPTNEQVSFAHQYIRDLFRTKPLKSPACREKFFENKGKEVLKNTSDRIRESLGILLAIGETGQPDCRDVSRGLDLLIEIKRKLGEAVPDKDELREEIRALGKTPYYETHNFKEQE